MLFQSRSATRPAVPSASRAVVAVFLDFMIVRRFRLRSSPESVRLPLATEQFLLPLDAPAVPGQGPVGPDDAVAGDGDRQRVGPAGLGHRTNGLRLTDSV